jgi:pimeloyl-ACP methyl ester carboxylesterase
MKKILKVLLYILMSIIAIVIGLALFVWANSPGTTAQIADSNGNKIEKSIASIEKIKLGGIDQYLIIRGADTTKPVMLYLHGGPGSPEVSFMRETNTAIENDFVMVYWEQRGAGKSYSKDIPAETMNLDQFIADTKELSEILARRFNKEKIYIMGHSWGSFLGILTAYQYPELFHAYLGVGQVCHQYKGEQISFEWVKEQAEKNNDVDAIEALGKLSFPDSTDNSKTWLDFLMVVRNYTMQFGGGVTHEMHSMWPVLKMVLNAKEYTFAEKTTFMSGSLLSLDKLWPSVINTNLFTEIDSMQVPVYIFQGKFDYQTPYVVAKEFYDQLKAPEKQFFTFENSAHSPVMEEVEKFNSIIREKL